MKYKDPCDFFKYIIRKKWIWRLKYKVECLILAKQKLYVKQEPFKLLKLAFENNIYKELIKGQYDYSSKRTIYIKNAVKTLVENCKLKKEKAAWVVGWLASLMYPIEWSKFVKKHFGKNKDYNIYNNFNTTNKIDYDHYTDIFKAASLAKYPQSVEELLKKGANPNSIGFLKGPVLKTASINNPNPMILKVLLKYGANPNLKDWDGNTALMRITEFYNNIKCVKILLDYGADPNLTNNEGKTALDLAKSNHWLKNVKLLSKNK